MSWRETQTAKFYFERVVNPMFDMGPVDEALLDAAIKPLRREAQGLYAHLADRPFLVANRLTIADSRRSRARHGASASGFPAIPR